MKIEKLDNEALIEASLRFPFYRWFYTEKGGIKDLDKVTYEDAPVLEKKFFFEYEEECGEPYNTGIDRSKDTYTESTSGTTGKRLEIVRPYTNIQILLAFLGEMAHQYLNTKPVFLTQEYQSGTVYVSLVEFPKRKEFKEVEHLLTIANVPWENIMDPDEVSHYIESYGANILVDATGHWTHGLMKKGVPLKELGIEVISGIIPDPTLWDEIIRNFKWFGMYIGSDGPGASTCPHCYERRGVYHPCEEYAEVYVVDGGKVKEYGEGLLIINRYNEEVFPFIKYAPQDLVKIEHTTCNCGKGKYLYMQGRAVREVRVPKPTEAKIRLDDTERLLSSEGNYLMIYAKVKNEKYLYGEYLALVTFLEKNISQVELNEELAQKIADINASSYAAYALPVIQVPEGTFTPVQEKDRKHRKFINVISEFPQEYLHLIDVARQGGVEIVVPEGSR